VFLSQYARERGLLRYAGSPEEEDLEFFDCTEPGESTLLQSVSGQQQGHGTSFRLRLHVAAGCVLAFPSDADLLGEAEGVACLRLSMREAHLTAMGGGAGLSAELSARELAMHEERGGESRPVLLLEPPAVEEDATVVPFKGSLELRPKEEEPEEGHAGPKRTAASVALTLTPAAVELSLSSLRRWLRLYSGEGESGSQGGGWALSIACPRLAVTLPFTPHMADVMPVEVLRACLGDEVEGQRWEEATARGPGFEAVLDRAVVEAKDDGSFAIRLGRAVLWLMLRDAEGRLLRLRVLTAEAAEGAEEGPFLALCGYAACQRYASSLWRTLAPRMREWEAVELNGDVLGADHRALPTDPSSSALHLHLPVVEADLTHPERLALLHLIAAVVTDGGKEADTSSRPSSPSSPRKREEPIPLLVTTQTARLVLHETGATAMDPLSKAGREGTCTLTVIFNCLCLYSAATSPHDSHFRATANDLTLAEAPNGGRAVAWRELSQRPVLYKNKWVPRPESPEDSTPSTPPLAVLDIIRGGPSAPAGAASKAMSLYVDLHGMAMRYRVESQWLQRLVVLLAGGVESLTGAVQERARAALEAKGAVPVAVLASVEAGEKDGEEEGGEGKRKDKEQLAMLHVFCTAFDSLVDYASEAPEGRAVLSLGFVRVSSNIMPGAALQGYKVMLRDLLLHLKADPADYSYEDARLCGAVALGVGGELDVGGGSMYSDYEPVPQAQAREVSRWGSLFSPKGGGRRARQQPQQPRGGVGPVLSDQQFLERGGFVQLATLNFIDAFLRLRTSQEVAEVVSQEPQVNVDVSIGLLHLYTCGDSFAALLQVAAGFWARFNDERQRCSGAHRRGGAIKPSSAVEAAEAQPPATVSEGLPMARAMSEAREGGSMEPERPEQAAPVSILGDIDPEMFVPVAGETGRRPGTATPRGAEQAQTAQRGAAGQVGLGQVVIDDFYQVGTEKAPETLLEIKQRQAFGAEGGEDGPEWEGGWLPAEHSYDHSLLVEVTELDMSETDSMTAESVREEDLLAMGGGEEESEVADDEQSLGPIPLDYARPGGMFDAREAVKDLGMEVELDPLQSFAAERFRAFGEEDDDDDDEEEEEETGGGTGKENVDVGKHGGLTSPTILPPVKPAAGDEAPSASPPSSGTWCSNPRRGADVSCCS
jgi:hypothetical protein